jgi:MSHA biogenesis protein MshM
MSSVQKDYLKLNPYLEITSGINAVLTFSEGVIKVVGSKGSGKTAVCHLLLDELKEEELEALLFSEAPESPKALEEYIQQKLALNRQADFLPALTGYILDKPSHLQKLVLIFDDSDAIDDETFQTIGQLSEIKSNVTLLVSIVLCGNENLSKKLNQADKQEIQEKLILSLQISPMTRAELEEFCSAYMAKVGLANHSLSNDDYGRIFEFSNGYPEKVPEIIYELLDQEATEKVSEEQKDNEKGLMSKLVELDDDPEPDLVGLSVEDREQVLMEFHDQVPWRWQSNGVAIAVVVLFMVVAYGWFVPPPQLANPQAIIFEQGELGNVVDATQAVPVQEEVEIVEEAVPGGILAPEVEVEIVQAVAIEQVSEEVIDEMLDEAIQEELIDAVDDEVAQVVEADVENEIVTEQEEDASIPVIVEELEQQIVSVSEPELIVEVNDPPVATTTVPSPLPSIPANTVSSGILDPALLEPQRFINNWVEAWENQDIDQYFQHYQERFESSYHNSKSMWRGDRQTKISRPNFIEIDVDGLELVNSGGAGLTVRFWLSYVSSYYKDRTLKEVLLTENGLGQLLIMQERNLEVEIIPYYP